MRSAALAITVLVASAVPAAADPPTIDRAIADAQAHGKLLVIELYADWCKPCEWFEQHILPREDVVAALATVDFVRYDVDTPRGERVVARYKTTSVPTFLAIDGNGTAVLRHAGLGGDGTGMDGVEKWFLALLQSGSAGSAELTRLTVAVAANARDVDAQLALARHYRANGAAAKASEHYRAIVNADPPLPVTLALASATAELEEILASDARVAAAADAAVAFARRFPESPLATQRIAIAAVSGRVGEAEIRALLGAHIMALPRGAALAEAIRLALGLHLDDLVQATLTSWKRALPGAVIPHLLRIETDFLAGRENLAREYHTILCRDPPVGIELDCYLLGELMRDGFESERIGVKRIMRDAADHVRGLEQPGSGGRLGMPGWIGSLGSGDLALGNAAARALRLATAECASGAVPATDAVVLWRLSAGGGRPHVHVRGKRLDMPVQLCMEESLRAHALPPATTALDDSQLIAFVHIGQSVERPAERPTAAPVLPTASGLLFFGQVRSGDLGSVSVGIQGAIGLGRVAEFRAMARGDLELGVEQDDEAGLATARGLVGLSYVQQRWQVSAFAGLGGSGAGPRVPTALEIPFELRFDADVGERQRVHLWARGAWVVDTPVRDPAMTSGLFAADEVAYGAGLSFGKETAAERGYRRRSRVMGMYLGFAREQRAVGDSWTFVLGLPVGRFF